MTGHWMWMWLSKNGFCWNGKIIPSSRPSYDKYTWSQNVSQKDLTSKIFVRLCTIYIDHKHLLWPEGGVGETSCATEQGLDIAVDVGTLLDIIVENVVWAAASSDCWSPQVWWHFESILSDLTILAATSSSSAPPLTCCILLGTPL